MSWNGKLKESPRLRQEEIASYISSKTSLNRKQVKECFDAYAEMIKSIYSDNNTNKDMEISLPHVGKFCLVKRTGRKNGTKYLLPDLYGGEGTWKIAKDEPSYYSIKFKVGTTLFETVKKGTSFIE